MRWHRSGVTEKKTDIWLSGCTLRKQYIPVIVSYKAGRNHKMPVAVTGKVKKNHKTMRFYKHGLQYTAEEMLYKINAWTNKDVSSYD